VETTKRFVGGMLQYLVTVSETYSPKVDFLSDIFSLQLVVVFFQIEISALFFWTDIYRPRSTSARASVSSEFSCILCHFP